MVSDEALIRLTIQGQSAAYGQLVKRYQRRLYHSLLQMLRDETEAEDATQEAFVLALVKLKSFRGNSSFFTWLYRIAFNAAISGMRKKRPQLMSDQELMAAPYGNVASFSDTRSDAESPETILQRREDVQMVQAGLARLADEHRAILVLREIEDFSYDEIAEILSLPLGTVRSRLHRARTQLKLEIERMLSESGLPNPVENSPGGGTHTDLH